MLTALVLADRTTKR